MTQQDRDRLVVLKKAVKKQIKQSQAAKELNLSARQVRRLLRRLKENGDQVVVHGLRGRSSNRKTSQAEREKIVRILSEEVYRGFGPTLASEYLANKHSVKIGREALRQIMIGARLWRSRGQKSKRSTSGGHGGIAAESWCNGTPASTIGWKAAAKSCT